MLSSGPREASRAICDARTLSGSESWHITPM